MANLKDLVLVCEEELFNVRVAEHRADPPRYMQFTKLGRSDYSPDHIPFSFILHEGKMYILIASTAQPIVSLVCEGEHLATYRNVAASDCWLFPTGVYIKMTNKQTTVIFQYPLSSPRITVAQYKCTPDAFVCDIYPHGDILHVILYYTDKNKSNSTPHTFYTYVQYDLSKRVPKATPICVYPTQLRFTNFNDEFALVACFGDYINGANMLKLNIIGAAHIDTLLIRGLEMYVPQNTRIQQIGKKYYICLHTTTEFGFFVGE